LNDDGNHYPDLERTIREKIVELDPSKYNMESKEKIEQSTYD